MDILTGALGIGCLALGGLLAVQTDALQTCRLDKSELQRGFEIERRDAAIAQNKALDKLHTDQQIIVAQYQGALNDSRQELANANRNVAAARRESDSLRNQALFAARALADATTPDSSIREYAVTVNGLFSNCQRDYQEMAAVAQGHAVDVKTLIAAWPTLPNTSK